MGDTHYAVNGNTALMELGSIPKFTGEQLSKNYVDVESMLRGIRSTNLEGPSFSATPNQTNLGDVSWFEKPKMILPDSFVHSLTQRPNYLN